MSSELAIRISGLSKCYQIYEQPSDRLKQILVPRLRRLAGLSSKSFYREFWALKDISLDIKRGETVAIIGKNGSGKSTLLQLICGTLAPSGGTVHTEGRVAALLELGSGFNPEFTGRENVYLNGAVLGLSKEQVDRRFDEIAAFADIGQFIEQPVKTYSSGMLMRLAFAVIAHVDADVLIVDEALAVGDAFFTQKCMRFLRNFMTHGTVLFVSHDTNAVLSLCNRAVMLGDGAIVRQGEPKEVVEHYMADVYRERQEVDGAKNEDASIVASFAHANDSLVPRDMRADFVNSSPLRNDIEIFDFDPGSAGFGTGDAKIVAVRLSDAEGRPLSWVIGGEPVTLEIDVVAHATLVRPIVGFYINNRLGQQLFGDNTFLTYRGRSIEVAPGQRLLARFSFVMPVLPPGDYVVAPAVAVGEQDDHVQLQWLHDALAFRVHASRIRFGLVGVAMSNITLDVF